MLSVFLLHCLAAELTAGGVNIAPSLRRTVAVMPWLSSRFWKAATRLLGLRGSPPHC